MDRTATWVAVVAAVSLCVAVFAQIMVASKTGTTVTVNCGPGYSVSQVRRGGITDVYCTPSRRGTP